MVHFTSQLFGLFAAHVLVNLEFKSIRNSRRFVLVMLKEEPNFRTKRQHSLIDILSMIGAIYQLKISGNSGQNTLNQKTLSSLKTCPLKILSSRLLIRSDINIFLKQTSNIRSQPCLWDQLVQVNRSTSKTLFMRNYQKISMKLPLLDSQHKPPQSKLRPSLMTKIK